MQTVVMQWRIQIAVIISVVISRMDKNGLVIIQPSWTVVGDVLLLDICIGCQYDYYLASAVAAIVFSRVTVSSSASCSLVRPPSSCVSGHESMVRPMVCRWPQSQSSDAARPHLCKLARHGPWSVRKRFSSVHDWRSRSKPGCWIVGSHDQPHLLHLDPVAGRHAITVSFQFAKLQFAEFQL